MADVDTLKTPLIPSCFCLLPHSFPWVVVSEYRASLQRRMQPTQEEGAFQSPPPPDAGGKGVLLDCTPAPTPTEVSTPTARAEPAPSCHQLVYTT